ncbi:ABC transporter permease [Paenibacillus protaetiae]|uniref:ATP-binding cassette domain-containing protein n=1 Tax=Paenibacillus protaetiae TaxID=2509456 RepID=A0A4P6EXD3_9BACL|nr:ATP-binding cassette domain-containing protein [Paenibacillus protaetiae]
MSHPTTLPLIDIQDVVKSYMMGREKTTILHHISLQVAAGDFLAIVGPSGSGKSTLMNIIGCLDAPTSGSYKLDGIEVVGQSDNKLTEFRNKKIGFIFQGYHLLPKLTALENCELPLIYRGMSAKERKTRASIALERVGLGERMHHRPNELSGGQQQRVGIARALATNPSLLLADEPTGALDSRTGMEVLGMMEELNQTGQTIVLITHDMEVAQRASRIVMIRDGRLTELERGAAMKIMQAFVMAFKSVLSNKLRTVLSMLGILIGVATVIALVAMGKASANEVADQVASLGTSQVSVTISGRGTVTTLSVDEADKLAEINNIEAVAPIVSSTGYAKYKTTSVSVNVQGITPDYEDVQDFSVQDGRYIAQPDIDNKQMVALIGTETAKDLFQDEGVDPATAVGQKITINGYIFTIVGLLESKGDTLTGSNDEKILIPITTGQKLFRQKGVSTIYVKVADTDKMDQVVSSLEASLYKTFRGDDDAYRVSNQEDTMKALNSVNDTMNRQLIYVAVISLIVGGIGIMNIMLVSVTERTREIGIRKSLGAKKRDILFQFLIEAMSISGLGGAVGIGIGYVASFIIGKAMDTPTEVPLNTVLLSFAFSAFVGIVFGFIPANKAAGLKPVDALRHD